MSSLLKRTAKFLIRAWPRAFLVVVTVGSMSQLLFVSVPLYYLRRTSKVMSPAEHIPSAPNRTDNQVEQYQLWTPRTHTDNVLMAGEQRKHKGYLTLGIPTIHRERGNYLVDTLHSLTRFMQDAERNETTIVVFLADFDDRLKQERLAELKRTFQRFMDSGLLRVIQAPRSFYPSLDVSKRTYNHQADKVKWRSKQNYDYAFLLQYSVNISHYYMQLEDDIETGHDYIQNIQTFVAKQRKAWVCLEFSNLGYIGKLYHSHDLAQLAEMLMIFYREQPPDVTYLFFNKLLRQNKRLISSPTLFQHRGYHSSLAGKVQPLKDGGFRFTVKKRYHGDNPPAVFGTDFKAHHRTRPEYAYTPDGRYFWAQTPKTNNYIALLFNRQQHLSRIVITTGCESLPEDYIRSGTVELGSVSGKNETGPCVNYVSVGEFTPRGQFDAPINTTASCIRITLTAPQEYWILFSEIAVFVADNLSM